MAERRFSVPVRLLITLITLISLITLITLITLTTLITLITLITNGWCDMVHRAFAGAHWRDNSLDSVLGLLYCGRASFARETCEPFDIGV